MKSREKQTLPYQEQHDRSRTGGGSSSAAVMLFPRKSVCFSVDFIANNNPTCYFIFKPRT